MTRLNEWFGAAPLVSEPTEDLVARAMRIYHDLDAAADDRAIYARLCEEAHIARLGGQRSRADALERAAAQMRGRLQGDLG